MKKWSEQDGELFSNSENCVGREYNPGSGAIDIARITISGRYPEAGYIYNEEAHEMAFVLRGSGRAMTQDGQVSELTVGDVVYFAPNERLAWEGAMELLMPCGPAFDPAKHHEEAA